MGLWVLVIGIWRLAVGGMEKKTDTTTITVGFDATGLDNYNARHGHETSSEQLHGSWSIGVCMYIYIYIHSYMRFGGAWGLRGSKLFSKTLVISGTKR